MDNNELIREFGYLIDKIKNADFAIDPYKHITIDNFLSVEHFKAITAAKEVNLPKPKSTEDLISNLQLHGYEIQEFPGCTTSAKDYLACYNSNKWPVDKEILEGFGLTFRLKKYNTNLLEKLVDFLNTDEFKLSLKAKFDVTRKTYIETAIQKYLHGYEISPHPDIRRKALTYMLNINPSEKSEKMNIHTYLMKFKPERKYILNFWENNIDVERCWVPWSWCESEVEISKNNSIIIFAPSNDTLHAVKLEYDHLEFQRTQLYGNLWYEKKDTKYLIEYPELDILSRKKVIGDVEKRSVLSYLPSSVKRFARKFLN